MKNLVLSMVFFGSVSVYASDTTLNRLFDKHYQVLEEKRARETAAQAMVQARSSFEELAKGSPRSVKMETASFHDKAEKFTERVSEFGDTVKPVGPASTRTIDELVAASAYLGTTDWRTNESCAARVATPATPTLSPQRPIRDESMMFSMDFDE